MIHSEMHEHLLRLKKALQDNDFEAMESGLDLPESDDWDQYDEMDLREIVNRTKLYINSQEVQYKDEALVLIEEFDS